MLGSRLAAGRLPIWSPPTLLLPEEEDEERWPSCSSGAAPGLKQDDRRGRPEPLRDLCVCMPSLCRGDLDISRLPHQVKVALGFLRLVCPWDHVREEMVEGLPPLLPPQCQGAEARRTLVLDLDETLVHCHPTLLSGCPPPALELIIEVTEPPLHAHVYVRPYAQMLLEVARERQWEVVIFTASAAIYADKVLDFLDPQRHCVSHRLYRQHCTEIAGGHFKDMRRLGRRLEDVVLVDNSPLAAGLSPDSSILVSSWFGQDHEDVELLHLLHALDECLIQDSIPRYLAARYGFKAYLELQQRHAAIRGETAGLAFLGPSVGPVTQMRAR